MTTQSLGAILNMIQNPFLYSDNEVQQNKLINDLQAICRMESEAEKAKVSKFNIYNYVAKDKMRPAMEGVFHDNGHRVASDSHILVVVNEQYAESYEGKIIGKDGQEITAGAGYTPYRYPKYEEVFSKTEPDAVHKIDMDAMPEIKPIKGNKEDKGDKVSNPSLNASKGVEIVDYSEKALAVIGDTKSIKDTLKKLGGSFNPRLSCGAGWIFSKKKEDELRAALAL